MFKKGIKNYFFSILALLLTTLTSFFTTPLIIKYAGTSYFGLYQLILQYLGYSIFCDLGISTASLSILNKAFHLNSKNTVKAAIRLVLNKYLKVMPIIFIFQVLLTVFLTSQDETKNNTLSYIIMALPLSFLPLKVYSDFLRSSEQVHIVSKSNTIGLLSTSFLAIYLSIKGYGILGLAISYFLGMTLMAIIPMLFTFKYISNLPILEDDDYKNDLEDITISQQVHASIQTLSGQLSYSSDVIILSFFASKEMLTMFFINQRLARLMDSLLVNVGNSFWSSFSNHPDKDKRVFFLRNINSVFIFFSGTIFLPLLLLNHKFINLWVGEHLFISDTFSYIVFMNYALFGLLSLWGWIFIAEGKQAFISRTILMAGFINVITSIIGTYYFHELGPVLGTFISFYFFYLWSIKNKIAHIGYNVDKAIKDFLLIFSINSSVFLLILTLIDISSFSIYKSIGLIAIIFSISYLINSLLLFKTVIPSKIFLIIKELR